MSAGSSSQISSNASGPAWIAVGLAIMIAGSFWPNAPTVMAIGLITLGATEVITSRRHQPASLGPTLLLHSITYMMLYALFIGARLHTPSTTPSSPLTLPTTLDLAASTLPMAVTLRRILACLRTASLSQP